MYKGRLVYGIIVAGGVGSRMGFDMPKQFIKLGDKTILEMAMERLAGCKYMDHLVLVIDKGHIMSYQEIFESFNEKMGNDNFLHLTIGGDTRQESVYGGINRVIDINGKDKFLNYDFEPNPNYIPKEGIVVVHDAARPFVSSRLVDKVVEETHVYGNAICTIPMVDTVIGTDGERYDRGSLRRVQTPQGAMLSDIFQGHFLAWKSGIKCTDESQVLTLLGNKLHLIDGEVQNIKITTREDLPMDVKVGTGYDVHRLAEGRKLVLGGVEIPFEKGLLGHSDADVCLHAIGDALLGAMALGDIGKHFPDSDVKYKGADSKKLLAHIWKLVKERGYSLGNLDCTIVCQRPKLAEHIDAMRKNIAQILESDAGSISIKATTTEGMGFEGEGDGISAQAVVLLKSH